MSTSVNPFIRPVEQYTRDIDPVGQYIEAAATHLSIHTGKAIDECKAWVTQAIRSGGKHAAVDPVTHYFERTDGGDRARIAGTLLQYVGDTVQAKQIMAPTFTTYKNPDQEESILAIEINDKKKRRGIAKKQAAAAKADKNEHLAVFYDGMQNQMKRSNNSLSGAANTASTPLYNKTSHSTLTTTCRITSGFGNACNEKLLAGNRHYHHADIVINDITAIVTRTDYAKLQAMMTRWQLVYPDVDQTLACITRSTDLYWRSEVKLARIKRYVTQLTALQRAAFVYTADLYHVKELNPGFMREFLTQMTQKSFEKIDEPLAYIKKASENMISVAHQLCSNEMRGIGHKYEKLKNPDDIYYITGTIKHIERTVGHYSDFIECIMRSANVPPSLGKFPDSIRRVVTTGDTDSTIFTTQDWVIWYMGGVDFTPQGVGIQAVMTYLTSSATIHILAIMSANMGIVQRHIFDISMKPEFRFDVFVPTQVAKTYYAYIGCKEGAVFEHHDLEIKGVMLKSSANPPDLNEKAEVMMRDICDSVLAGKKISMNAYLNRVAAIETQIIESVKKGQTTYLKTGTIKAAQSYSTDEEDSPYQTYLFWCEALQDTYGVIAPPPYSTSKVSLSLTSPTKLKEWLAGVSDEALRTRLTNYFARKGKTSLTTLHIPTEYLEANGVPAVFLSAIDEEKIAGELCKAFYLILETLGYYGYRTKVRRLIKDQIQQ
jgi:hypothetical protein